MAPSVSEQRTPMLSILCLTYNHEAFIGQALESFLAQVTSFEVEVVVADDCSSDRTATIVESFSSRFGGRLSLLRSPVNLGVTRNFRRAYRACRGRYVAICEGDDFWRGHNKLQTQVDFLEANPDYVICYHDATIVEAGVERTEIQLAPHLRVDSSREELIATRPISTLTTCFRKVLDDLPLELDQAPALDLCLWSLLGQHGRGKHLGSIDPAGYRVHATGVYSTQSVQHQHMMMSQSLLSLARVYGRLGLVRESNLVLLKALQLGSVPLGALARLRLIGWTTISWIILALPRPLVRIARKLQNLKPRDP